VQTNHKSEANKSNMTNFNRAFYIKKWQKVVAKKSTGFVCLTFDMAAITPKRSNKSHLIKHHQIKNVQCWGMLTSVNRSK